MGQKISACLVVYNEEKVIERCLRSIAGLADEIIVVHDGPCEDKTLEIAKKFTDKIYIRPHIGIAEPHRVFSFETASNPWIFQIDADEFVDTRSHDEIRALTDNENIIGYYFKWELWDGKGPVYFKGLQKLALFQKDKVRFQGLPQKDVETDGGKLKTDIVLHHQPLYENISWKTARDKRKYWLRAHVPYFFPELVTYYCYRTTIDSWIEYTRKVRKYPWVYIIWYPIKNCLGQLKNGLWTSRIGINIALQQYFYYVTLYSQVRKMHRKLAEKRG